MPNQNSDEIVIPNRLAVLEDKKTKVKTVYFPFQFPDGANGVISITKLKTSPWKPSDDIESVYINYNKSKQFRP
jgi:hypothetical protein